MFLKNEIPTTNGYYWFRHIDSASMDIGLVTEDRLATHYGMTIHKPDFHRYLWAGPIPQPEEKPLGVQMAEEANDNKLLTPREMFGEVLSAFNDPSDTMSKINKAIFIGLLDREDMFHTATLRCNMSNSEALALLHLKAHEYAQQLLGHKEHEA